ncbi:Membrane proteinase PrsW, cleaves anti-sigma factor RsiW, M82 family [Austwickia chelonae]|uniref:Protease PrsW n=1 Tax=Austwickia chelonae NBRC 105200 TaxID=1184607 RepID=K6VQ67_9MICO|nr:PrsW family intramembrane metalloprotease [Austwickia chelonae]GAB78899.1 hypothetical protein AUCHE_17_01110 [Austwickia chelonae NBRC 105200]SEV86133.1 Membrane proteinase PrsW, cleaves anti-sigma factor RsiW, M82 family [Austwickia chelonae]
MNNGDQLMPATHGHELFRPRSALWWTYLILGVALATAFISTSSPIIAEVKTSILTFLPFYAITGGIFAKVMLTADPYRARRPWVIFAALGAGASLTLYPAMMANSIYPYILPHVLGEQAALDWMPALAGPTSEEWTKMIAIVLVMLLARQTTTRPMHGLMVGGFVGLGFQLVENVSYGLAGALQSPVDDFTQATTTNVMRFVIGFTSHNVYSAIVGVGVAILLRRTVDTHRTAAQRVLGFVGFYTLGWFAHFLWNSPPLGDTGPLVLASLLGKALTILGIFFLVLRWVWRQERRYLEQAALATQSSSPDGPFPLTDLQKAAIGPRKTRRTYLKEVRAAGRRPAVKKARAEMRTYLDHLQAWDRRGTGIDEHPRTPSTPAPSTR